MFTKMRRRFVMLSMASVVVVLTLIMAAINGYNYASVLRRADAKIGMIEDGGGSFREAPPKDREDPLAEEESGTGRRHTDLRGGGFSEETPFNTRYFTVTLAQDDTVSSVNTDSIAAVDADEAKQYAADLADKEAGSRGFCEGYRYAVYEEENSGRQYIFLDVSEEMASFRSFLTGSILVSLGGLAVVLILVILASRAVVRPMAESYEKQKQFITDASHELKTPLAVLAANNDVIEMESGESQWTKSNARQIERLTSLVEKLVFLSRMDEGKPKYEMRELDFSNLVRETADSFASVAMTRGRKFTVEVADGLRMMCDEKAMVQLVSLLVDNAIKYSDESGSIRVSLTPSKRGKTLTVWNTVESIPAGNMDRLFERFYRLDSSRSSKTGGYGLGLAVARAIVESHRGSIHARSTDGKSLEVTVQLP